MQTIKTSLPIVGFWDSRKGGRPENQDSFGSLDTPHGLLVIVCDGMGGGPAGKEASVIAVRVVAEYVSKAPTNEPLENIMANAVERAHTAIISAGENNSDMKGMGSTIVSVLFNDREAIVAHVGDSRLYQFRRGQKVFRTQDHSWVAERIREGVLTEEIAKLTRQTNLITRALGGKGSHEAEIDILPYERGDRFMLCTDGIWGVLSEKELCKKAGQTPSLSGAVDSVALLADEIGRKNGNKHDNLTVALFEAQKDSINKVKMNRESLRIIWTILVLLSISVIINLVLMAKAVRNTDKDLISNYEDRLSKQSDLIASYHSQVDSLQKELNKATKATAEALMEAASEKAKAAEKAEQEAKKKLEEAERAAEKAKEEKALKQKILKERGEAISFLKEAVKMKKGHDRSAPIKQASNLLTRLAEEDIANKQIYKHVKDGLSNNICYSNNNNAKSHLEKLIKNLENIK